MKPWQKTILIICCLLGMSISFIYHFHFIYNSLDETKAPVHVNIEIDKAYMAFVSIMASDRLFPLSSTEYNNDIRNTILHTEIRVKNNITPFTRKLFLYIPREEAQKTLNAIDNISIFIGNKMFYFSHSDIVNLQGMEQDGYMLYELPKLEYEKSIAAALLKIPQWINWYGDFNLAVKIIFAFITQPGKFIITWCFLICLLILCWSNIKNIYSAMQKQKMPMLEMSFLGLIILTGFVLRLNGYVRYSSWVDELYSACRASNPVLPFMSSFEDPGNPPFYYILLRFWFMLFGWTEESGRLFSVLTGTAAIISLYVIVKRFTNKKSAFLASVYMAAVSTYIIGFSQEMRPYILEVFLVSIAAHRFLIIIQERELSLKNLIGYIIPSVLLVNTHYYGGLFVFASFLFFLAYSVRTKTFTWKKTILFFTGNIIIASSLLPYFIHTAWRKTLLNSDFNTWISRPGLTMICMAVLIPLLGILYIYARTVFQKIFIRTHRYFLDYAVFVMATVYLIAFGISLYRPILVTRYLVILYPFLVSVIAITIVNIFTNSSKFIGGLCIVFAFVWVVSGYEGGRGGNTDIFKESQAYISKDAEAHSQNESMEVLSRIGTASFYGYVELPLYVPGNNYDVLYFNPLHRSEEKMYSEIAALGIDRDRILRIRVNNFQSVFKIYSDVLP